jgi:NTP pyrophosphatase (non-canonical NTP hydrolase)
MSPKKDNIPGNVPYDHSKSDNASKAAEEMSNKGQDTKDDMKEAAKQATEDIPKTPEEFINTKGFTAWQTAERYKQQKEDAKNQEKFSVDLDKYLDFCNKSCSEPSKDFTIYVDRLRELNEAGANIQRLDTAAAGMSAEAGEFMEIVKKMKFQGKPWDDANKEHLIRELGDVMWYVAQACHALGVRLDDVLYANTLKLAARYPGGEFNVSHSENRKAGDL